MNMMFYHWIDRNIGLVFCVLFSLFKILSLRIFPRRKSPPNPQRIIVLKFWGMGSIVLSSPALRKFKERHPSCHITFVTLEQNREICELIPDIDAIATLDLKHGVIHFLWKTLQTLWRFHRNPFDYLYDLEFFTRFSALFSFLVSAHFKVGFHDRLSWRGNLYDRNIPFNNYWHVSANFLNAFVDQQSPLEMIQIPGLTGLDKANQTIRQVLFDAGFSNVHQDLVVINPHTGFLTLLRRWSKEHFILLARELLEGTNAKLVFVGNIDEREYTREIVKALETDFAGRILDLSGKLSIAELAGLFGIARLLITNDSGPLHLAGACGTPTVSFFGPETPILYGPLGENHLVYFNNLSCSPCINVHTNKLPICIHEENRCLLTIKPEQVFQDILQKFRLS